MDQSRDSLKKALVKKLNEIELNRGANEPRFRDMIAACTNVFERQKVFKEYYEKFKYFILENTSMGKWFDTYEIDFFLWFTPIERNAWGAIRYRGMIFYPQYPALNYFLDFANPHLKIAIELDGKEFHNATKDKIRDENLFNEGWKVFRITGAESFKDDREPREFEQSNSDEHREYLTSTLDGIIQAIYTVYFSRYKPKDFEDENDRDYYNLCIDSLKDHCLCNTEFLKKI